MDSQDPTAKYLPAIAAWFRSLPEEPVVRWTAACLSADEPLASAFVDIEVPALLHELKVGWIWTVVPPDDDRKGALEVPLEYDAEGMWTPNHISDALGRWVRDRTGRKDIRFVWDATIYSMLRFVFEDAIAETKESEMIEISGGVRVAPGLMDYLLSFPSRTRHS